LQLTEEPNGNTLVISLADENDAGDYICQVSTYKPTDIKHSVRIRGKITVFNQKQIRHQNEIKQPVKLGCIFFSLLPFKPDLGYFLYSGKPWI
jgi:hypothetical protein